ncbi:MAG: cytidine deaminase [Tissierellia bacterium]|nr:cytidine deaminase [Tissierellia bacterium]
MERDIKELIKLGLDALPLAYTPYSNFKVAAVLETLDGRVYTGVNIENAAYTPTNCAERTAFFKAISEGDRRFRRIVVLGGKGGIPEEGTAPCGVCRQVMMEFCDPKTFEVIIAKSEEEYRTMTLEQLLPEGFGPDNLKEVPHEDI